MSKDKAAKPNGVGRLQNPAVKNAQKEAQLDPWAKDYTHANASLAFLPVNYVTKGVVNIDFFLSFSFSVARKYSWSSSLVATVFKDFTVQDPLRIPLLYCHEMT
jgi:hypothetical protein